MSAHIKGQAATAVSAFTINKIFNFHDRSQSLLDLLMANDLVVNNETDKVISFNPSVQIPMGHSRRKAIGWVITAQGRPLNTVVNATKIPQLVFHQLVIEVGVDDNEELTFGLPRLRPLGYSMLSRSVQIDNHSINKQLVLEPNSDENPLKYTSTVKEDEDGVRLALVPMIEAEQPPVDAGRGAAGGDIDASRTQAITDVQVERRAIDPNNLKLETLNQFDDKTKVFFLARSQAEALLYQLNHIKQLNSTANPEVVFSGSRIQTGRMVEASNMAELERLQAANTAADMSTWFTLKAEVRFPGTGGGAGAQNNAGGPRLPMIHFLDPCPPGYGFFSEILTEFTDILNNSWFAGSQHKLYQTFLKRGSNSTDAINLVQSIAIKKTKRVKDGYKVILDSSEPSRGV